jgi:hypothetical protein
MIVGVHRQIGFDPLEACDHAGERAHMLSIARHRRPRRHGAVAAAGHHQLGARAERDRLGRPARVAQFLAAAGRALRALGDVMLDDGRAQQIVTDDVIVQLGAKAGRDRLGDFEGGKLDGAMPERVAGER